MLGEPRGYAPKRPITPSMTMQQHGAGSKWRDAGLGMPNDDQYVRTGSFSISARTDRSELDFGQSLERRQDSETARRRAKLAQQVRQ